MIIVDVCIICFHFDCIMQLKYSYYIATYVCSRKSATTFGDLPDCSFDKHSLPIPPLNVSHGPVIISHVFMFMHLFIHTINPIVVLLITVCKRSQWCQKIHLSSFNCIGSARVSYVWYCCFSLVIYVVLQYAYHNNLRRFCKVEQALL